MEEAIFLYLLIGFILGFVTGAMLIYKNIEQIVQARLKRREDRDHLERHR